MHEKLNFRIKISDTHARYNMFINVRNKEDYSFSNLYLFMQMTFPDGRITRDTIECYLADYDGKWLGTGLTGTKFNRILFQKAAVFPMKGDYLFTFEQAMRTKELKGITDIGIRLEKE